MTGICTVAKRELKGYFATPVAYVFLVIFLFFAGYLTVQGRLLEIRQADMRLFFDSLPLLFVFMVPAVAMRLWSEERRTGTVELLFTLPITVPAAVVGKFLAAWAFLGIALVLTAPMPLTVAWLGNPDGGPIVTAYIGSFLMAGFYLAIGCFFSAVSKNQVISFILAVVACAVMVYAGLPSTLNALSGIVGVGLPAFHRDAQHSESLSVHAARRDRSGRHHVFPDRHRRLDHRLHGRPERQKSRLTRGSGRMGFSP